MMDDYRMFVPNVHYELIPIKNLVSNQEYQRIISQNQVKKVAANFDIFQINPVKVSRRDGINYVFNGQHTIETVALVSGSRDTPVWCMIYDDLDNEHEADIFANQQKYVKPLSAYEVYIAHIEAGNDKQLLIKAVVESYGLTIGKTKAPGVITCVSTLERIFDKYGYEVLDRTLRLVIGSWEGDISSFAANILSAVATVSFVYGEKLNDEIFVEKVGAWTIKSLTRTARERRPGIQGFWEAIMVAYNFKSKFPLNINKLYQKTPPKEKEESLIPSNDIFDGINDME